MRKAVIQNTLVAAVSTAIAVVITFAAGELYFRLAFTGRVAGPPTSLVSFHPERGWALNPGEYSYINMAAFRDVHVSINRYGLRHGDDLSLAVPAGLRRITLVGDSFVFASALNYDQTIAAGIRESAGPQYEVVAVSVEGYGTGQQLMFLEELIAAGYEVGDYVVFAVFANDILDNVGLEYYTLGRDPLKPIFSVSAAGELLHTRPTKPPFAWIDGAPSGEGEFLFARFLESRAEILATTYPAVFDMASRMGLVPRMSRSPAVLSGWYEDGLHERWAVSESIMTLLARKFDLGSGTTLAFAYIASPFQVSTTFRRMLDSANSGNAVTEAFLGDSERPQRTIGELSARLGVPFVDTTGPLSSAAESAAVFFPREGHLNEHGTKIVADSITNLLLQTPH
jgi:hypothetical protein